MEEFKSQLYKKYGDSLIPSKEINNILHDAAKHSFICKKDIKLLPQMNLHDLFEFINDMRRSFIYSDCLESSLSYEEMQHELSDGKIVEKDPRIIDKVLKAYLEYQNITTPKNKPSYRFLALIFVVILLFYIAYTPAPY